MAASWVLFALLQPVCYAAVNLLDKFLIAKKVRNYYAYSVVLGLLALLSAIIIGLIVGFPKTTGHTLTMGIFAGGVFGLAYLNYFRMLSYAEVSRIVGVGYLYPAFVAFFSFIFLAEKLSLLKYGAILVAVMGALMIGIENQKKRWKLTPAFWLMIGNAVLIAIVDTTDKYVLQQLNYWQVYVLITIPFALVLMSPVLRKSVRDDLAQPVRVLPAMVLIELFTIGGAVSFLIAASLVPVALVSAMATLQPVIVFAAIFLMSKFVPHILKEKIAARDVGYKIAGIALVVFATVVLSL